MLKDHSTELRDELLSKRPATPLPWITNERTAIVGAEAFCPVAKCDAAEPDAYQAQDAAYIVHAANSYPRLVEALKDILHPITGFHNLTNSNEMAFRALLNELGELGESERGNE
jgi:hypothetical protein